ncbi:co(2)-response secreted protease [Phtheirospermum japonicum]|uniref:Co(2)-response secreted protease n=1 Tax=Phtheirospermum japonicum TaxID=374723 RepID=A0A830B6T9_9LAMI|nr:co(2)-response secreted protease [Phtheirospermum japonicum]
MGGLSSENGAGRSVHAQLQSEIIKRKRADSIIHTYNKSFLGFAARLSDGEAKSIAQRSGVVSVFPDQVSQLHTTRSWDFLWSQSAHFRFDSKPTSSPSVSDWSNGADTIIGILDTGIWPEHPSFNDKFMRPIPPRWKGECKPGNYSIPFKCNKKLIGARYYVDPNEEGHNVTARDLEGHGTHVASIAAGRHVWGGASYYGLAQGIPRGGSPESRIAAYRVCAPEAKECPDSSLLKAFDDAIADGVDVISISIGPDPKENSAITSIDIGSFHAVEKGITVVCSAGNDGPVPMTVVNVAPWLLTVAATTIDRDFETDIVLGGKKKTIIKGGGINFSGLSKSPVYPLVDGRSAGSNQANVTDASNCIPGSLDDRKVQGKIVLCQNKDVLYGATKKFEVLKEQGAIGLILITNYERQVEYTYGTPPTSPIAIVDEGDGALIQFYINSTSNPLATILPTITVLNHKPAPVAAVFSSRGPINVIQNLLKPDIAAPGVDIFGAWRFNDTHLADLGKGTPFFNIISGTSQACPHVSGVAATVKSWHPTWSPSAIKSAIMTTAIQTNNLHAAITKHDGLRATPYDIGAGEISLFGPLCPGLVYETETIDYLQFLCNMGYNTSVVKSIASTVPSNFSCPSNSSPDLISDMNYPSIAVSGLIANGSKTVKRTVTNVGEAYSTYTASVEAPAGMHVQVVPNKLQFTKYVKKQSFQVTFILTTTSKGHLFGSLAWSNWKYKVRSPLVVNNV